ncbi:hypothetical protein MTO96_037394 [Rhipicephalus appendiculatus]
MVDHVNAKMERVPVQGSMSARRFVDSDLSSTGEDSARATMYQPPQQQQPQSRCDELSSNKRTTTLDMDSAHHCDRKQARNLQSLLQPVAEQPLSPFDVCDRERSKLEERRRRNRIAQANCRQRQLDRISRLQEKVDVLVMEKAMLISEVNALHDQLSQERMTLLKFACQKCSYLIRCSMPADFLRSDFAGMMHVHADMDCSRVSRTTA